MCSCTRSDIPAAVTSAQIQYHNVHTGGGGAANLVPRPISQQRIDYFRGSGYETLKCLDSHDQNQIIPIVTFIVYNFDCMNHS